MDCRRTRHYDARRVYGSAPPLKPERKLAVNTSSTFYSTLAMAMGFAIGGTSLAQPLPPGATQRIEALPQASRITVNKELLASHCPAELGPKKLTLEVTPTTISNGSPVEILITPQCPFKGRVYLRSEVVQTAGNAGMSNGMSYVWLFQGQISNGSAPILENTGTTVIRFAQRPGIREPFQLQLRMATSATGYPSIDSNNVVLNFEGSSAQTATPPATDAQCRPTLTLNVLPSAVIGGATVPVELRLSCALAQDASVQILSSNANLLPGPPANTVTIPAGQTSFQFQLTAARNGTGTVSLRALLSQPAIGGMTPPDTLTVTN